MANATLGRILLAGLGVLVYKNRDRLGEVFRPTDNDPNAPQRDGSLFDQLSKSGGIGDILNKLRQTGAGGAVDTWLGKGPNEPLRPSQVEAAIDEDTLQSLSRQTGMSREELLQRLATNLPETVDELSPEGEMSETPPRWDEQPDLLDPVPSRHGISQMSSPGGDVSPTSVPGSNRETHRRGGTDPQTPGGSST